MFIALGFAPFLYLVYMASFDSAPASMKAGLSIGLGVFGSMIVCLYVFGNQLITDFEDQRYETYRSMPMMPSADLIGRLSAGVMISSVAFLVTILVGAVTGASYSIRGFSSIPIIVAAFVFSCVLWMIVSIPMVMASSNERYAELLTTITAVIATLITGNNGVMPGMAMISQDLLNFIPNSLSTRVLSYHLIGEGGYAEAGLIPPAMPSSMESLGLLAFYGLISAVAGIMLMRKLYNKKVLPR
ncbi:MAG: ABC transporter permease [Nanohaloarchaea archaeon]|nr:ABC transporter permease [Candidatus Nanohaloarchaea archaeon]